MHSLTGHLIIIVDNMVSVYNYINLICLYCRLLLYVAIESDLYFNCQYIQQLMNLINSNHEYYNDKYVEEAS